MSKIFVDTQSYSIKDLTGGAKTKYYVGSAFLEETEAQDINKYSPLGFLSAVSPGSGRQIEEFGEVGSRFKFTSVNDAQHSISYNFVMPKATAMGYFYTLLNRKNSTTEETLYTVPPSTIMIDFSDALTDVPFNIIEVKTNVNGYLVSKVLFENCLFLSVSGNLIAATSKTVENGTIGVQNIVNISVKTD